MQAQAEHSRSTLELYRTALHLRRRLQTGETLEWRPAPVSVLDVVRPGGWRCVANFGTDPVALPPGEVLVASGPTERGLLPGETTAWLAI